MKKRMVSILCCITMLAVSLAACGEKENTTQKTEKSEKKEENLSENKKDELVCYVGHVFWEESMDPVKGAFSYGWSFINNALLKVQPDSTYAGDLAESWEVSDDALTYTFHLREGIEFQDGSPLTAEDIVFTYKTVQENQGDNENVDLSKIASIEQEGDYTVKFTLSEPYSPFLDATAQLGIVPSESYDSEKFNEMPIGTGAWKVVQYDPEQQLIVEANEEYFDGVPEIKKVTFVNMDNEAAFSNAQSGQLDIV
ncbi:MAG: ABC transporter substrate-binding protein, partial [Bacillota bacterium]|nr:ABC transporter substrate-binding protein [Bacillota bacterium]